MIFEEKGMFTTFQRESASDVMAQQIANALVGNKLDAEVIEMTFIAPVIHFDEPTLIALTGADFRAYTKERELKPYQLHLMNHGETLKFKGAAKGTRAYMAVGGGVVLPKKSTANNVLDGLIGVIQSGDTFELKRCYSKLQKKLLHHLQSADIRWGVDYYGLAPLYYSDVYHLTEAKAPLTDRQKAVIESDIYEVTHHFDRSSFVLEGESIGGVMTKESSPLVRGAVQVNPDGQLIVIQNDMEKPGRYPHIATIAPYHLPKLSQKKPGSKIIFRWVDEKEMEQSATAHQNWMKSLLKQIDYQLNRMV